MGWRKARSLCKTASFQRKKCFSVLVLKCSQPLTIQFSSIFKVSILTHAQLCPAMPSYAQLCPARKTGRPRDPGHGCPAGVSANSVPIRPLVPAGADGPGTLGWCSGKPNGTPQLRWRCRGWACNPCWCNRSSRHWVSWALFLDNHFWVSIFLKEKALTERCWTWIWHLKHAHAVLVWFVIRFEPSACCHFQLQVEPVTVKNLGPWRAPRKWLMMCCPQTLHVSKD